MTQQQALINVVNAWDALPRGRYTPDQIERWMQMHLWHAVNDAREALGLPRSDAGSPLTSPSQEPAAK